jgi:hypothetical protein
MLPQSDPLFHVEQYTPKGYRVVEARLEFDRANRIAKQMVSSGETSSTIVRNSSSKILTAAYVWRNGQVVAL